MVVWQALSDLELYDDCDDDRGDDDDSGDDDDDDSDDNDDKEYFLDITLTRPT